MMDEPSRLERLIYGASFALALVPVIIAAYVWGADLIAGHLPR